MKKILIVSSDKHLLGTLDYELSLRGYAVDIVNDPSSTTLLIQFFFPDLLVIDFILDDHNGGAISHQVKSDPETRHLPVILLSDYELETHYPWRFGCDRVIEKKAGIALLLAQIHDLLESRKLTFYS